VGDEGLYIFVIRNVIAGYLYRVYGFNGRMMDEQQG
jgi:hypothetical protein